MGRVADLGDGGASVGEGLGDGGQDVVVLLGGGQQLGGPGVGGAVLVGPGGDPGVGVAGGGEEAGGLEVVVGAAFCVVVDLAGRPGWERDRVVDLGQAGGSGAAGAGAGAVAGDDQVGEVAGRGL